MRRMVQTLMWLGVVLFFTVFRPTPAEAQDPAAASAYEPIAWRPEASLRLQVTPKVTQVYVDGYYAGIADDFDGTFQRLHAAPGEHELTLYLEGYRTLRQRVLLSRGSTQRIKHTMVPLAAGERADRPSPPSAASPTPGAGRSAPYPPPRDRRRAAPREEAPPGYERPEERGGRYGAEREGSIAIRVQPSDAEVFIDGERWQGPDRDRLVVEVPEGAHRVEVRKEGFDAFTANVQVRRGETTTLNVTLTRGAF